MRRSVMRRCLKGLGGFPTSTDGFILGPSHGLVGRLAFVLGGADTLVRQLLILPASSLRSRVPAKLVPVANPGFPASN